MQQDRGCMPGSVQQGKQQRQQGDSCDQDQAHTAPADVKDNEHKSELNQLLVEKNRTEQVLLTSKSRGDGDDQSEVQAIPDDVHHQHIGEGDVPNQLRSEEDVPHKLKSEEDVPHQLRSKDDVPHKQSGQSLSNTSREIISGPSAVFYPLPSMLSLTELLPERVQLSQKMVLSSELLPVSITQVSAFSNAQKIIPGTFRIHDAALKLFSTNLWRSSNLGAKVSRATNFSVVYNNDHSQPAHGDGIEQAPAQL